jgi:hypothetical protein
MNIESLTIKEAREIAALFGAQKPASHSFRTGEKYFIRTVTHYYTGRLVAVTESDLVLDEAAWIADTGRFATALSTGTINECEPFPGQVLVSRGAVVDACEWNHELPKAQK